MKLVMDNVFFIGSLSLVGLSTLLGALFIPFALTAGYVIINYKELKK